MTALKGYQKKHLRGLAHGLKPVVQIGREGITEGVIRAVDEGLFRHELIKIKFNDLKEKDLKEAITGELAAKTGSDSGRHDRPYGAPLPPASRPGETEDRRSCTGIEAGRPAGGRMTPHLRAGASARDLFRNQDSDISGCDQVDSLADGGGFGGFSRRFVEDRQTFQPGQECAFPAVSGGRLDRRPEKRLVLGVTTHREAGRNQSRQGIVDLGHGNSRIGCISTLQRPKKGTVVRRQELPRPRPRSPFRKR